MMYHSIFILIFFMIVQFNLVGGQIDKTEKSALFGLFVKKFAKIYRDGNEFNFRFQVFQRTLNRISKLNSKRQKNTDAIFGITRYSDLTPDEFKRKVINEQFNRRRSPVKANSSNNLPNKYSLPKKFGSPGEASLLLSELDSQNNRIGETNEKTDTPRLDNILATGKPPNLSEIDKLIEAQLSFHVQLDGFLDSFFAPASNYSKKISFHSAPTHLELSSSSKEHTGSSEETRFAVAVKSVTHHRTKRSSNRSYFNVYDESLPSDIPRKKDWRENNAVSEVDNQGVCGACWAHSTLETIESMAAIKYGWPISKRLSVQQLIDCSSNNYGCLGGDNCAALAWISANKIKIASAKAYPTRSSAGECQILNDQIVSGFTVLSNFTCTNFTNNEIGLIKLLATHGPVATNADATLWQDYLGGIIQFNCGKEANHAVQIVGYNLESETPYYIVRNTWSSSFGLNGYLHVAIGSNLCALEERVSALDVEMI